MTRPDLDAIALRLAAAPTPNEVTAVPVGLAVRVAGYAQMPPSPAVNEDTGPIDFAADHGWFLANAVKDVADLLAYVRELEE